MLSRGYTLENGTALAELEGVPLGGRGLKYNLRSKKAYTIRISRTNTEKLNSRWRCSAAEMQGNSR